MQGVAVLARAKTSRVGHIGAFQNVSGPLRPYMPPQSGGNGAVARFAPLDDTLVGQKQKAVKTQKKGLKTKTQNWAVWSTRKLPTKNRPERGGLLILRLLS